MYRREDRSKRWPCFGTRKEGTHGCARRANVEACCTLTDDVRDAAGHSVLSGVAGVQVACFLLGFRAAKCGCNVQFGMAQLLWARPESGLIFLGPPQASKQFFVFELGKICLGPPLVLFLGARIVPF